MKKNIAYWQTVGFIFTAAVGTLLHFLLDWTGDNATVALFSAVNESIWEHLKLLFYPMVAFALVEYFRWGRQEQDFWCVKLVGIAVGIALIPVLYYTYTGALGVKADWFNITIFFLVAAAVYWLETKLFSQKILCPNKGKWAKLLLAVIALAFTVFTFLPPRIPLFQDPLTGTYGFWKGM